MNTSQTINISTSTVLRVVLVLLFFAFLYVIRDILMMVLVGIVIAIAVNGPVNWLQKHRVPRLLGVVFIYLVFSLILTLIVILLFPPLAEQIRQLTSYLPELVGKLNLSVQEFWGKYETNGNLRSFLDGIGTKLDQAASSVIATLIDLFGGLFSAVVVLVISFYLAVQEKGVKKFLTSLIPDEHQQYFSGLLERIEIKIGAWLRGQLLLMSIIGILTFIGLYFLGVKYALILALIAAILEIVPYAGPIVSAVPAVILAFSQSPALVFLVVLLYIVIQQLENYIIVPQVMKRTVGLNPIIIIIVMLVGAKLAGVLGIILSVPLTAALAEFFKDFQEKIA